MTVQVPNELTSESFLSFIQQFKDDQPSLKQAMKNLEGSLWEYESDGRIRYLRFGWRAYCSLRYSRCLVYFNPIIVRSNIDDCMETIAIRLNHINGILRRLKTITFKDNDTILIEYMDGNTRTTPTKRGRR